MRTEVRRILRRTLGFTLIELLVVIAIIAVLIALLLPAIQAAREAARRADCTNRLKQFGLAISNYYDVNGMLPPADVHDWGAPHTVFATRHYHTMYSFILPYMGQQPLYDSINYDYPPRYEAGWPGDPSGSNAAHPNRTIAVTAIDGYMCPSDGESPDENQWYYTNYRTNIMTRRASHSPEDLTNGVLPLVPNWTIGSRVYKAKYADIQDGTSKTAMMSEGLIGIHPGNGADGDPAGRPIARANPKRMIWRSADVPNNQGTRDAISEMVAACDQMSPQTAYLHTWTPGRGWFQGDMYWQKYYDHTGTPNKLRCADDTDVNFGSHPPSSNHSGGVNVLYVDGSVSFVSDSIDQWVWTNMGTRNGDL